MAALLEKLSGSFNHIGTSPKPVGEFGVIGLMQIKTNEAERSLL